MAKKLKNVTFSLPVELLDELKQYVEYDCIPSVNAGVREALEEYAVKLKKEILAREMEKAAKDPLFMNDLEDCMKDFEAVDSETARRMDEW
jgi:metal-responsive CopG/Arc/MetJ family transcriptional regulator